MTDHITSLFQTPWGAEQWILEGWNKITPLEKDEIQSRMDNLFLDGLPFEIQHNKILYIYIFSFLAQLEVLAIQIPLKFEQRMSDPDLQKRMRQQLLDEIFHGLVFTKIVYMLIQPFAFPPPYNEKIEELCNFIRDETCPKTAVMLLNLVAEGWIEEIFSAFAKHGIAPKVFHTILEDETRHVCEAELYRDIGIPSHSIMHTKMMMLEKLLMNSIFLQDQFMSPISTILGIQATIDFLTTLSQKHHKQLQKIGLVPSDGWKIFIQSVLNILPQIARSNHLNDIVPVTPMRQLLITQWDNPTDPTQVGEFDVDISTLDFFNNKYPKETCTFIILKALSQMQKDLPVTRQYLNHDKLYRSENAYIGLVVKLPDCQDHLGTIVFENAHLYSIEVLKERVYNTIKIMTLLYKKREALELKNPSLKIQAQETLLDELNAIYSVPLRSNAIISLSNVGPFGYQRCKSPLRKNEAIKITLLEIQKKPYWNTDTNQFEPRDFLPVSSSVDHRIFDGNIPLPKLLRQYAEMMLQNLEKSPHSKVLPTSLPNIKKIIMLLEKLENNNERMLHKFLVTLQTYWYDFLDFDTLPNLEKQAETV